MPYADIEKRRASQRAYEARKRAEDNELFKWKKAESARRGRRRDPVKATEGHLIRTYGLSLAAWSAMLRGQGQACAICRVEGPDFPTHWHTDHDHATGSVRGILCQSCNHMLGQAKDNPETLQRAASYLQIAKVLG